MESKNTHEKKNKSTGGQTRGETCVPVTPRLEMAPGTGYLCCTNGFKTVEIVKFEFTPNNVVIFLD